MYFILLKKINLIINKNFFFFFNFRKAFLVKLDEQSVERSTQIEGENFEIKDQRKL